MIVAVVALTTDPVPEDTVTQEDITANAAADCRTGRFPNTMFGRPAGLSAGTPGAYLWIDGTGWHMEAVDDGTGRPYRVRLLFTSEPIDIVDASGAKTSSVVVEPEARNFDLPAGPEAAQSFLMKCSYTSVTVELQTEAGVTADNTTLWVGPTAQATSNPEVVKRQ